MLLLVLTLLALAAQSIRIVLRYTVDTIEALLREGKRPLRRPVVAAYHAILVL